MIDVNRLHFGDKLRVLGLLDGSERARYPHLAQDGHTFKEAEREQGKQAEWDRMF